DGGREREGLDVVPTEDEAVFALGDHHPIDRRLAAVHIGSGDRPEAADLLGTGRVEGADEHIVGAGNPLRCRVLPPRTLAEKDELVAERDRSRSRAFADLTDRPRTDVHYGNLTIDL